jgi:hypothetical protein
MTMLASVASYAQSGTHYSSNGIYRLNYSIFRTNAPNGHLDVDMFGSVSSGGAQVKYFMLDIMNDSHNELPTGGTTYDFYKESNNGDILNLHVVYDDSLYYRTSYLWYVEYTDGSYETYYEDFYR